MKYFFLIIFTFFLNADICEIFKMEEILKYSDRDSILIFDIDNTLITTKQLYGSDQWFSYEFKKNIKNYSYDLAFEKTLDEWFKIQALTEVKPIEENIPDLIKNLQSKNFKILALTTGDIFFALPTIKQLNSVGIDLPRNSFSGKDIFFENGTLYKNGIIFCSGLNKGEILNQF